MNKTQCAKSGLSSAWRKIFKRGGLLLRLSHIGFWCVALMGLQLVSARADQGGIRGADYFPNVKLTTQDGRTVRFFDDVIRGKVVLINFIYTSCGSSCPLETARIRKVRELLGNRVGKDIHFYSITIDPQNDTVETLKAYHSRFRAGDGWTFLTGQREDILQIQKKLGLLSREQEAGNLQEHDLNLIVGNQATGQWIRRSHLENTKLLAGLLEGLQIGPSTTQYLADYRKARTRLEPPSRGEQLYYSRCVDCHSLGGGDGLGPDLAGVVNRRPREWLRRWILEPDKMLEERDPSLLALKARFNEVLMPNLKLSEADVSALIDFLGRAK